MLKKIPIQNSKREEVIVTSEKRDKEKLKSPFIKKLISPDLNRLLFLVRNVDIYRSKIV